MKLPAFFKGASTSCDRCVRVCVRELMLYRRQLNTYLHWKFASHRFSFIHVNIVSILFFIMGASAGMTILVGTWVVPLIFASDVTQSWTFSNAADYSFSDSTLIGVSNNSAHYQVRSYTSTDDTALLFHFDDAGSSVTNSSSHTLSLTPTSITHTTGKLNNAGVFNGQSSLVSVADDTALSLVQSNTLETWFKLDSAFSAGSAATKQTILDKGNYKLYLSKETGKLTYELAPSNADSWTQVAGGNTTTQDETNQSWDLNGKLAVDSQVMIGTDVYAGIGNAVSDAAVWKWNGTTWTKIGGDGVNNSWAVGVFEDVFSLATDGTNLYAGLGSTVTDAEVWKWDGSTWTKIGGDGVSSSWNTNYEIVTSLVYSNNFLYAGLGLTASDGEVWKWDGSTWSQVGGDSLNSSWGAGYEYVLSMTSSASTLYAGLATTAGEAEVWSCAAANCTAWTKIGGDAVNSSWADATYENVRSLTYQGTTLYAGLGLTANDAEVWSWNGSAWTQIGGDTLNSSWPAGYEEVWALTGDGTNIYAGLGSTAGDNEVWSWNGTAWTKIGGDAINSGFTNTHTNLRTLVYGNSTLYAGLQAAAAAGQVWSWNGSAWTLIGGNYVNNSWGYYNLQSVESMTTNNNKLYAGTGYTVAGNALVWEFDGSAWTLIGGQGKNSSWAANTFENVLTMISYQNVLYVGLGTTANDAEVWSWNGTAWTKIGGDSLNSGWTTNYETVQAMAIYNNALHVGLGNTAGDAEVWSWNGTAWTKIGGDALNSSWAATAEAVFSLAVHDGYLYAGTGTTAGDGDVWRWNGTVWNQIGGDGLNSGWAAATFENAEALGVYQGKLVAGLGLTAGDAELWSWDGSAWTKFGGDGLNSGWADSTYERVRTLTTYNGSLMVGLGLTAGDGEVWGWDGSTWTKIGGDNLNNGWSAAIESVGSMSVYKGKLYAGMGDTANADALIYAYGNNAYLESTVSSWDTNWHHVAATYDGSTMKLYVDGTLDASLSTSLTLLDTVQPLLIGTGHGNWEAGLAAPYLAGQLDELRVTNTALTSFNTTTYTTQAQTVQPTAAVLTTGVKNFDSFVVTASLDGGTLSYRLSADGGTTWKYWNGSSWATSGSTAAANTESDINAQIGTFSVGEGGIMWQAILSGNGNQNVTITQVDIGAIRDVTAPDNPTSVTALSAVSGSAISSNVWYGHTAPSFTWTGAADVGGSGVAGYYVYFGPDVTADPLTAGTFQTSTTYTASNLTTGQSYYLRLKTKDAAQNTSATTWEAFTYKLDSAAPINPALITVNPTGYAPTNSFTFSWPTSGASAATDAGSGLAGYQYKTGTSSGTLSEWSPTITTGSISITDAAYTEGENIFYLRTVDTAGNVNATPLSLPFYFAGEGASVPLFLTVNPGTSTTNSFSFSWSAPATHGGASSDLTYCYTVNVLPSATTCTFTSAGANSLSASAFATQQGQNTFYLVAKNPADAGGAINYGSYASVTFSANTSSPGIPLDMDVADISIKSNELWRLTVSWNAPSNVGSGVSRYQIHRSLDNVTFSELSTTTGTAHIDSGLTQAAYYYKVRACDNVNNCGAFSEVVSLTPTGKYTDAAPLTAEPKVSGITTKQASIAWSTERKADSKIAYGTSPGSYFPEEPSNPAQKTDHTVNLKNLTPGTTYFYQAKWTDEDGNTGKAPEKSFSTEPAPVVTDPQTASVGLSSVTLKYTVKGASKVKIYFGTSTAFGGLVTTDTSTNEATYTSILDGLEDGTKYYYKINSLDTEGAEYEGNVLSFETLPRPKISAVRIQQVKNTAQPTVMISWVSNTEISTIATYYPEGEPALARDEVNIALRKGAHSVIIQGLRANTKYVVLAKGRDKAGNEATSELQRFTTATDTRPPQISGLKVEGTNISAGDQQQSQLVVSWKTDEPASSQVEYGEGTGANYQQRSQEDANLKVNHVVIISGLTPSKVYHLRAVSRDSAANPGTSIDTVSITPKATDQALNLVINNLQQVFGFMGGTTK